MIQKLKKLYAYIKYYGIKLFIYRVMEEKSKKSFDYQTWFKKHQVNSSTLKIQQSKVWEVELRISVLVPLYNTNAEHLHVLIQSMKAQSYKHWELILADGSEDSTAIMNIISEYSTVDARIRYTKLPNNMGISGNTNAAFHMASGDYIGLLDHDDFLEPDALYCIVEAIQTTHCDVVYTDEDKVSEDGTKYFRPTFKPDYNPFLLRSNNYICHFFVFRKDLVQHNLVFDESYDGAQDYDLILRVCEEAKLVKHIPRVLYHWRSSETSTSANPFHKIYAYEAGRRAIQAHYQRLQIMANVSNTRIPGYYESTFPIIGNPRIAIYILDPCDGISSNVRKRIFCHGLSSKKETHIHKSLQLTDQVMNTYNIGIHFIDHWTHTFIEAESYDYVVYLSSGCIPTGRTWLQNLLGICQLEQVAVVGGKIVTSDHKIYSAGIHLNSDGRPRHLFHGLNSHFVGYRNRAITMQNLSAVSGKFMMIKKDVYKLLGGFSVDYQESLWDVDFCLKVREAGYQVVYQPHSIVKLHSTMRSISPEVNNEDLQFFHAKWKHYIIDGDPYYNRNFSSRYADYTVHKMPAG